MSSEKRPIKKRNRPSLVCTACRKRKIKCDKGRPCSACVRNKTPDLCRYDSNWVVNGKRHSKGGIREEEKAIQEYIALMNQGRDDGQAGLDKSNPLLKMKREIEELEATMRNYESEIDRLKHSETHDKQMPDFTSDTLRVRNGNDVTTFLYRRMCGDNDDGVTEAEEFYKTRACIKCFTRGILECDHNDCRTKMDSIKDAFIGILPFAHEDEEISPLQEYYSKYSDDSDCNFSQHPFTWCATIRIDPVFVLLRKYCQMNASLRMPVGQETAGPTMVDDEKLKQQTNGPELEENKSDQFPLGNQYLKHVHSSALTLGLTLYHVGANDDLKLLEKVIQVLPNKKVLWLLTGRFFTILYPYFPFLDEATFRAQVSKMIGPELFEEQKINKIDIDSKIELANLACFLVILRLTYVSLFSNKPSVNENILRSNDSSPQIKSRKYLMSNPVDVSAVDLARLCFREAQGSMEHSFKIVQCAYMLRMYLMVSPEEGDGMEGIRSLLLNNNLVLLCMACGMNREPDNILSTPREDRKSNLKRRMWYFLISLEILYSYLHGNPILSESVISDVRFPYNYNGEGSKPEEDVEYAVAASVSFGQEHLSLCINALFETISRGGRHVRISELTTSLSYIELVSEKYFGELEYYCSRLPTENVANAYSKMVKLRIQMGVRVFHLCVSSFFFTYYERNFNQKLNIFYLKKLMRLSVCLVLPYLNIIVGESETVLGDGGDMIMNPALQRLIHVLNEVFLLITVRVGGTIYNIIKNPESAAKMANDESFQLKYKMLCRLMNFMEFSINHCNIATSLMSQRYYYSWGINKTHNYYLKVAMSEEFYASFSQHSLKTFEYATVEDMEEILDFTYKSLRLVDEGFSKYKSNSKYDLEPRMQLVPTLVSNMQASNKLEIAPIFLDMAFARKPRRTEILKKGQSNIVDNFQPASSGTETIGSNNSSTNINDFSSMQMDLLLPNNDYSMPDMSQDFANYDFNNVSTTAVVDNLWLLMLSNKTLNGRLLSQSFDLESFPQNIARQAQGFDKIDPLQLNFDQQVPYSELPMNQIYPPFEVSGMINNQNNASNAPNDSVFSPFNPM